MERVTDQGATLKKALALTCVILVVELAGGVVSHSLALLSDAGHVLTDVFALGLAWFALEQAKRPADRRRSYGYQRVSILAALVNSVTLIVIVIAIAIEAVRRLANPEPVQAGIVIVAALVAIAVNAYVVVSLRGHGKNLNLRAALLHVTGDIGASAGVVVAGAVILLTRWFYIDPLLSLGIAGLIAYGAWRIVRETVNLLLEGTPREINVGDVTAEISKTDHVEVVHARHVIGFRDLGRHVAHVDLAWSSLQQKVHRLANDPPGAVRDEAGDAQRQKRVDVDPPGQQDDRARHDHARRSSDVSGDVQQRGAQVQVLAVPAQADHDVCVDGDGNQRCDDHDPALHRLGVGKPAHRLDSDRDDDHDQGHGVDERGEDADPLVAVAAPPVGGPLGLLEGEPREAEREDVGQDVPGVG